MIKRDIKAKLLYILKNNMLYRSSSFNYCYEDIVRDMIAGGIDKDDVKKLWTEYMNPKGRISDMETKIITEFIDKQKEM